MNENGSEIFKGFSLNGLTLRLRASKPTIRFTQPEDLKLDIDNRSPENVSSNGRRLEKIFVPFELVLSDEIRSEDVTQEPLELEIHSNRTVRTAGSFVDFSESSQAVV